MSGSSSKRPLRAAKNSETFENALKAQKEKIPGEKSTKHRRKRRRVGAADDEEDNEDADYSASEDSESGTEDDRDDEQGPSDVEMVSNEEVGRSLRSTACSHTF